MQAGFLNPGGGQRRRRDQRPRREGRDALDVLPEWAWLLVLKQLDEYDHLAFGLTCRTFLDAVRTTTEKQSQHPQEEKEALLRTDLTNRVLCKQMPRFTFSWYQWVLGSFDWKVDSPDRDEEWNEDKYTGHFYDSDLMYLAAFQGSKKVMEWLVSQGICLDIGDWKSVEAAASGGHIHVLKWLGSEGCL